MTTFSDRVLDGLGPAFADRAGPLLARLVEALTSEISSTDELLQPTGRGWATAFDLDRTSLPAYVGHITGTNVPKSLDTEAARAYVAARASWRRGTPLAIRTAVAAVLTGPRTVRLVEREGSPWRLTVRVYGAQLPGGNTAPVLAAIATQKPVGIIVTLLVDSGASSQHMRENHGPTYADYKAAFATYAAARDHEPEGDTTP